MKKVFVLAALFSGITSVCMAAEVSPKTIKVHIEKKSTANRPTKQVKDWEWSCQSIELTCGITRVACGSAEHIVERAFQLEELYCSY